MKQQQFLTELINQLRDNGKFFSITFVKKDGTIRKMVAKFGVKTGVTGKGMNYNPLNYGNYVVYDTHKRWFRTFNIDRVLQVKVDHVTYNI